MNDTERNRIKAICDIAHIEDIGNLSDGFHTFNQLYYQRMMLFAVIVKQNRDKAWKSKRHEDGELCFGGGWFIVGITTPEGDYTYHYEDKYFDLFDCAELECGNHWDGHTEKDVTRLLSLPSAEPQIIACGEGELSTNLAELGTDLVSKQEVLDLWNKYHSCIATKAIEFDSELRALPSAEPQVIMCQHCNEYDTNHHYCNLHEIEMSLTDFCSYAERMEVEHERHDIPR